MKRNVLTLWGIGGLAVGLLTGIRTVQAQIIPDATLPVNSIAPPGCTVCTITGGTERGVNLYHSFREFSIPTGGEAWFNNATQIQNILTRVTGTSLSNLDGLLRANGTANLFLLNPNGIVFGPNARLQLGGSLFATTANSLKFSDGSEFSAKNPQAPPLLTVDITPGVQTGVIAPGATITNRGNLTAGQDLTLVGDRLDLQARDTPSFINAGSNGANAGNVTLIAGDAIVLNGPIAVDTSTRKIGTGGNITIQARSLTLDNGAQLRANTSGTGDAGNIKITANSVQFKGTRSFSTATDNNQDLVASGAFSQVASGASGNGGNIDIETQSLRVAGGAQVSTVTNGQGSAGRVTITATQQAVFDGTGTAQVNIAQGNGTQGNGPAGFGGSNNSSIFPYSGAFSSVRVNAIVNENVRNNLGSVTITTPLLQVTNGARITSSLSGVGNAGDVNLNATSIVLSGAGPNATVPGADNDLSGGISVLQQGTGNGGNININTQMLKVENGIVIAALTRKKGDAGRVTINATDSASFDRSYVISEVQAEGVGNGGGIDIATGVLSLTNGAQFRASTFGRGNAGNVIVRNAQAVSLSSNSSISTAANAGAIGQGGDVTVQTGLLSLNSNAQITASTYTSGRAGDVTVTANGLEASSQGQISTTTFGSGQAGNITLNLGDRLTLSDPGTAILANTAKGSSGQGGNILIDPRIVEIKNGARIAVDSAGTNQGGNITITAGRLTLDNGSVTAETASNQGGNITINAGDLLLLRRNSLISATAGTAQASGNGGNITINTPFVISVLPENSDLRANAFSGNGGNITINANQIFGLRPQAQNTSFSDITASSQLGINGNIILNTLNLDPSQGLQELNLTPIDPSNLVAQGCNSGRKVVEGESKFVVLGRGGLTASPDDPFGGTAVLNDLGSPTASASTAPPVPSASPTASTPGVIVEAQSWMKDAKGKLYLVSQSASAPVDGTQLPLVQCSQR